MKKDIHPSYKEVTIVVDGKEFVTKSTMKADRYVMDINFMQAPAWNKSASNIVDASNQKVSSFKKKFGSEDLY